MFRIIGKFHAKSFTVDPLKDKNRDLKSKWARTVYLNRYDGSWGRVATWLRPVGSELRLTFQASTEGSIAGKI